MGKRQHQQDKMYMTANEWSWLYGGRRPDQRSLDELATRISRLPFNHCCLSLQPVSDPVCNCEGYIFERKNLLDFMAKFNCDPITGKKPFTESDIIPLKLQKSTENADAVHSFQCPVLFKTFTENSHIVVIKTTGNVFSHEAVDELNVKTKNYRDLLTDEPFTRKDIIVLQDPMKTDRLNPSEFYHFKNSLKWMEQDEDKHSRLKKMDNVTKATLSELDATYKDSKAFASTSLLTKPKEETKIRDEFNTALFSTGKASTSFTSTVMDASTKIEADVVSDDVYRYSKIKKKGYASIETNLGIINIELYCQHAPRCCENFLKLSQRGYYDDTTFHRSIKNFMIQGGK
jgi:peptidyl-prolyl cis-trans isomerase-like protein 2